jgi:hypothetical protein
MSIGRSSFNSQTDTNVSRNSWTYHGELIANANQVSTIGVIEKGGVVERKTHSLIILPKEEVSEVKWTVLLS